MASKKEIDVINKVAEMMLSLGIDLEDPNFEETPERFAKYMMSRVVSKADISKEARSFERATFPAKYRSMVVVKDIEANSLCPHHLIPVLYKINVGYIPKEKVVGLSKIIRFAKVCAQSPMLQEEFTDYLADTIEDTLVPLGVIVTVTGQHFCMKIRGVEQPESSAITSAIRGVYATDKEVNSRMEFFELLQHNNH